MYNGPDDGFRNARIDNYDWLREQRRKQAATTAGTNQAPTPQSNPNTICGRLIDASVVVGGFGGLPIASGGVGIAALGGSAYPAPTFTGLTASTTANPLSTDLLLTLTLNNVPQDRTANQVLWVYRLHGNSTWTPWAETALNGLPTPPASQTVSFGFAQLQSGQNYDIGIAYTGLNGMLGAIAVLENNYVMPSVAVPTNYLLGTLVAPTIASATASTGASSNGISSPLTLNWTCTNQPTDGSLSRLTVYVRQASGSTWTPYASIPAVGVSSSAPPAVAPYAFTITDLTNGLTYDFGTSYENAQGGEGSTTAIITGVTLASVSAKGMAMPATTKANGPTVSTSSIGAWIASGTANPVLPVTFTIADWASGSAPSWLLGERLYVRQHGVSSSAQPFMDVTPGQNVTTQVQVGLNAATTIDLGVSYLDAANNESAVTWPAGISNIVVPYIGTNAGQTTPGTISSSGPTIVATTQNTRNRRTGMTQNLSGTVTIGDWGSSKPNWVQAIMAYSRIDGTTTVVDQVQIDPNAPSATTASTSTYPWQLPGGTGDSVDIGFAYEDVAGHLTAISWPAALNNIADPDGSVWDGSGKGQHTRMSAPTQTAVDNSGRVIGSIYDGSTTRAPSDITGTILASGGGIDFASVKHINRGALALKNTVDLGTGDVVNKIAANITYTGGATVDSLKPAQAGADITASNTAADTAKVNGTAAVVVASATTRANAAIDSSNRVIGTLYDAASTIALTPGNVAAVVLASASADGSSIVTSQVTTRTLNAGSITNNKVAGTSVSGTQVFPACYSTQSLNASDNAATWATAATGGAAIASNSALTNGQVIYYNTGSVAYGYPPAANPRTTTYTCPASGSVTCVFNHVAFSSGGSGVVRVNFNGSNAGSPTTTSTTAPVSGSGNVGWGGTQNPTTHIYTYNTVNTTTQSFSVTTSQGASTTYPLSLNLTSVTCPSDGDGYSDLMITVQNPSGTTVATWSGITAGGTWTYNPTTADAAGTYIWSISTVSHNNRVAADTPYGSSYTASYSGTATYWITSGASGNTYVLAADGTTQRLTTLDGNIQLVQSSPDTLAFKVYNSCTTSALSFSVGVDVTGV